MSGSETVRQPAAERAAHKGKGGVKEPAVTEASGASGGCPDIGHSRSADAGRLPPNAAVVGNERERRAQTVGRETGDSLQLLLLLLSIPSACCPVAAVTSSLSSITSRLWRTTKLYSSMLSPVSTSDSDDCIIHHQVMRTRVQ
jgi:hypothetical protein